jgi:hypothetical protein
MKSGRPGELRRPLSASSSPYRDLTTVHSRLVFVCVKPWPLHEFCPLQAFFAPLHALCPLQALAPGHTICADAEAATKVLAANTAAAVATIVFLLEHDGLNPIRWGIPKGLDI